MNIVTWLIFGLITGVTAHLLDSSEARGGLLGTVLLGILGAMVGGLLANLIFGANLTGFSLVSFVVAILGSLLLLFVQRAVRRTSSI
jgi:uncharacterized membrane protein YeaQ/YmgE (transglycosylase-associated protein family)